MGGRSVASIMSGVSFDRKRKIANNTVEYWQGETRIIRLHDTDIVKILPNGDTVLNSGGWRTVTTKDRMSGHGARISQERGIWYVHTCKGTFVYADGMIIHTDGSVEGAGEDPKATFAMLKKIKTYAKGFVAHLVKRQIPKPAGDKTGHLLSHFEEKYYVPSLLHNAVEEIPVSQMTKSCIGYWMGYHDQDCGSFEKYAAGDVEKILVRYLKRRFGIAS